MKSKEKKQMSQQNQLTSPEKEQPDLRLTLIQAISGKRPSSEPEIANQVHLTLQGKGGVGKSFVSSLVAQYLRGKHRPVVVVDTDPVNATLSGYKSLDVQRLELMQDGTVNERNFDSLVLKILDEKDCNYVVDNGSASFVPLCHYIIENETVQSIVDSGKEVFVHTVITGGSALMDTLIGFEALVNQMSDQVRIVVWLNEFLGKIESDGKTFEEMKVYQNNKHRIHRIVRITQRTATTYGEDIKHMMESKMTFDEVNMSLKFNSIEKSRLFRVKKAIFDQLEEVI
jgi:hypothetical protein